MEGKEQWITINGTHVLVDENGNLQGDVGKKITEGRKTPSFKDKAKQYKALAKEKDDAVIERFRAEDALQKAERENQRAQRALKYMPSKLDFLKQYGIDKDSIDGIIAERDAIAEKRANKTATMEDEARYNITGLGALYYEECYGEDSIPKNAAKAELKLKGAEKRLRDAVDAERKARLKTKDLLEKRPESEKFYTDSERSSAISSVKSSKMWEHMTPEAREAAEASMADMSDAHLQLLQKTASGVRIWSSEGRRSPSGSSSWYTKGTGAIQMSEEDMKNPSVLWHEYGHYLDDPAKSGCSGGTEELLGQSYTVSLSRSMQIANVMHGKSAAEDFQKLLSNKHGERFMVESNDEWKSLTFRDKEGGSRWAAANEVEQICSDKFREFVYSDKEWEEYCERIGYPMDSERPDINDYVEFYTTPKRKLQRQREKFAGAEEAYRAKVREFNERRERALEDHRDEFIRKSQEYEERRNTRESHIGPVSDILCGCVRGEGCWIYGGHSEQYYSRSEAPMDEAAANYHQMRCMGWSDAIGLLHSIVPHVADGLEQYYNEWLWRNLDA